MIFNMVGGGGSSGAAVNVTAVASASALPASADEGDIAIVSTVAVNNVYVQNDTPSAPEAGDVLITTANSSNAPAQIGNITIYPNGFKQYQSGSWVVVTGYVYSGGAWVGLELWLFTTGNAYQNNTGGWGGNDAVTTIDEGENLRIAVSSGSYNHATIYANNKIRAGKYSKLMIVLESTDYACNVRCGFSQSALGTGGASIAWDAYIDIGNYAGSITGPLTHMLDLSSIDDTYEGYFFIYQSSIVNAQKTATAIFSKVYLTN